MKTFNGFARKNGPSQCQILVLTVLFVPNSLDSGPAICTERERIVGKMGVGTMGVARQDPRSTVQCTNTRVTRYELLEALSQPPTQQPLVSSPPTCVPKSRLESTAIDNICDRIVWMDIFLQAQEAAEWMSTGGCVPQACALVPRRRGGRVFKAHRHCITQL